MNDQGDAYKFIYPFGWQEVSVTGQVAYMSKPESCQTLASVLVSSRCCSAYVCCQTC